MWLLCCYEYSSGGGGGEFCDDVIAGSCWGRQCRCYQWTDGEFVTFWHQPLQQSKIECSGDLFIFTWLFALSILFVCTTVWKAILMQSLLDRPCSQYFCPDLWLYVCPQKFVFMFLPTVAMLCLPTANFVRLVVTWWWSRDQTTVIDCW